MSFRTSSFFDYSGLPIQITDYNTVEICAFA